MHSCHNNRLCLFFFRKFYELYQDFPGGSDSKKYVCSTGNPGLITGSGRSLGEENGNPLQYPCLGNPVDRGAWWAVVHGVAKSHTQLND